MFTETTIDFLSASGGRIIKGFRYAIGDTPQTIVNIDRELYDWRYITKVMCGKSHGLKVGDKVYLHVTWADSAATVKKYEGEWVVIKVKDDWFAISPKFKKGDSILGTWQLASTYVAPVVVAPKISPVIWYVAGGLAVLVVGFIAVKKFKHKGK